MKQLLQNLRDGAFTVLEAPPPSRLPGFVLVSNRASLISSGTERSTVRAAQAGLLGKARQRPDKVQQVLDNLRKEGPLATLKKVQEKLGQPKALGYSSAGVVVDVDPMSGLRTGDRVACAGQDYASHAEIVTVPRNLVVPLPDALPYEQGAFVALGAIALQGVRRAGVGVGDRVLVIGLGLLGQLIWQLAEAAGCVVIGTDISAEAVERAAALGLAHAVPRNFDVLDACRGLTDGHGVDATIVAASAASSDPIELAGQATRERGRVSVVGKVLMEFPHEIYYRKELDVAMSRSYGPGRYDAEYEEGGVDYPYGFVRWTEQRNMAAFLETVARGRVDLGPLITHRFPLVDAPAAYEIVSGRRREPHVAIVLTYPDPPSTVAARPRIVEPKSQTTADRVRLGVIGAGSFARSYLLPHLAKHSSVFLHTVATAHGHTASDVARRFRFSNASTDPESLLRDADIDAVVIATRHDQHAPLARLALERGKHVFVEKPLAVSPAHLADLLPVLRSSEGVLQVGFNRRFSPLATQLKEVLSRSGEPTQITYRVNAGALDPSHWLVDPIQGGGRIVGEGCHFIDLMQFLTEEEPVRVTATSFGGDALGATSVLVELSGGSTGMLVYQANSSPLIRKEWVEAARGGRAGVIDDWRRLEAYDGRKSRVIPARAQSKGHAEEIAAFIGAVLTGRPALSRESQVATTEAMFAVLTSLSKRHPVEVTARLP